MASIWISLDSVPVDDFMTSIVVPMIRALGENGIHPNLKATTNHIFQNEGTLVYALFPGGKLSFVYTTGPTFNPISGGISNSRYMMATIRDIPNGVGITEQTVDDAIRLFQANLSELGIYPPGGAHITDGGSLKGKLKAQVHKQSPIPAAVTRSRSSRLERASPVTPAGAGNAASGTTTTKNSQQKNACFIATAVYGDYDTPQVRILRRFRDENLGVSSTGRAVIRLYYRVSPALVHHIGDRAWFRNLTRPVLDAFTSRLQKNGFSDAAYTDPEQ